MNAGWKAAKKGGWSVVGGSGDDSQNGIQGKANQAGRQAGRQAANGVFSPLSFSLSFFLSLFGNNFLSLSRLLNIHNVPSAKNLRLEEKG